MSLSTQQSNQDQVHDLSNTLNDELHLIEVETFEVEDVADAGQEPANCSCCSFCTSTSSTSIV